MQRLFIISCLSCCFFAKNSSRFFNFLAIFCAIFSESILHIQFSPQTYFVSFSLITPLDLSKEQYPNFSFPNVSPPRLPQLRIIFANPIFPSTG